MQCIWPCRKLIQLVVAVTCGCGLAYSAYGAVEGDQLAVAVDRSDGLDMMHICTGRSLLHFQMRQLDSACDIWKNPVANPKIVKRSMARCASPWISEYLLATPFFQTREGWLQSSCRTTHDAAREISGRAWSPWDEYDGRWASNRDQHPRRGFVTPYAPKPLDYRPAMINNHGRQLRNAALVE